MMESKKIFSYGPDDSGKWCKVGPATKKHWPNGIPPLLATTDGTFEFREYAGFVYRREITEEVGSDEGTKIP